MQKVDRMLMAILVGVVGLVLIAFVILLTRPKPAYLPDDSPGAAVHNYLLALQQADNGRAYSYVSPSVSGYPKTIDAFQQQSWQYSSLNATTLAVGEVTIIGSTAVVKVTERNADSSGALGGSGYSTTITFSLHRNPNTAAWQIVHGDQFWPYCWEAVGGC